MKFILSVLIVTSAFAAEVITKQSPAFDSCIKEKKNCASVDMEHPKAEVAYKLGCEAKDFYACFRLGQLNQYGTKPNVDEALKYYQMACDHKDEYGCEGSYDLYMELCYDKELKKYCGKKEPKREYAVWVYLKTFDKKYFDAFNTHDFSYPFSHQKLDALFDNLMKAKSKKLLEALRETQKKGKHDGADAEAVQSNIWILEGKPDLNNGL